MNVNAIDPAMPSPPKMLEIENLGLAFRGGMGERCSTGSQLQNSETPPR